MDPTPAEPASEQRGGRPSTQRTVRRVAVGLGLVAIIAGAVRVSMIPLGDPTVAAMEPRTSFGASNEPAVGLQVGMVAPDFADASDDGLPLLVDLDGRRVRLGDFTGRPVWIVFWATWCVPCQQEASDILAVYHAHEADGLVVLAIDEQEPAAAVSAYASEHHLDYPIGLDVSGAIKRLYGGPGLPTHYFLDVDHVIRDRYVGQMTRDLMERHLAAILR